MLEGNPCVASGCHGFCCQNIDLELTKFERTRVFPNAKRVNTLQELARLKEEKKIGVFYSRYRRKHLGKSGFVVVSLNGPCPNRLPDDSCAKHEEREYAARNFEIGCDDCNAIRKENGLAPIFIEPVE
jgi:hypothetical protein